MSDWRIRNYRPEIYDTSYHSVDPGELTHCPLGGVAMISNVEISNTTWGLISWVFKQTLEWMSRISWMVSQHWFRYCLSAIRQQVITWASVDQDLWRHIASLGHDVVTLLVLVGSEYIWRTRSIPQLLISQGDHPKYHKTSNINRTLVSNKTVDHSDVVGVSPAGAAPTTSSYLT